MENLYIIAASEDGPCKIGRAKNVDSRLKQLRTGNPYKLEVFGKFNLHYNSSLAEYLCHWVLHEHRTAGGNEWFDVNVREATLVAKQITRTVAAVDGANVVLGDAVWNCAKSNGSDWAEYEMWHDDDNDNEYREFPRLNMIFPSHVMALMIEPEEARRFNFDDYIKSFSDGYPTIEQNGESPLPCLRQKSFNNILPAIEFLHNHGLDGSIDYTPGWLYWCHGRDCTEEEVRRLVQVWNNFAPRWNSIFDDGVSEPEDGVENVVNGVEFYAIHPNENVGHGGYLCFENESFRITLKLPPKSSGLESDFTLHGTAQKISAVGIVGHIAPFNPDFSQKPFKNSFSEARSTMNRDLANWLSREEYEFPKARPETKDISNFNPAYLERKILAA